MNSKNGIYPLTIVADRYSGSYSGGKYSAWNLEPWQLPYGISDDDVTCMNTWWKEIPQTGVPFGVGGSPEDAVSDLQKRIEKANENGELVNKLWAVFNSDMEWDAIYNFMTNGGIYDYS